MEIARSCHLVEWNQPNERITSTINYFRGKSMNKHKQDQNCKEEDDCNDVLKSAMLFVHQVKAESERILRILHFFVGIYLSCIVFL